MRMYIITILLFGIFGCESSEIDSSTDSGTSVDEQKGNEIQDSRGPDT